MLTFVFSSALPGGFYSAMISLASSSLIFRYIIILPASRKAFRHLYGLVGPVAVVTTLGFTAFTAPSEDYHASRLLVR